MFSLRPERQLERTLPRRSMRGSTQEDVAPSPIETVQEWLGDVANDVVVVGHSQGVNIAMSMLNRGLDLAEPNSHRAQFAHWSPSDRRAVTITFCLANAPGSARAVSGPGRGRSGTGEEPMLSIRRAIVSARNPSQIRKIAAEPVFASGSARAGRGRCWWRSGGPKFTAFPVSLTREIHPVLSLRQRTLVRSEGSPPSRSRAEGGVLRSSLGFQSPCPRRYIGRPAEKPLEES